MPNLSPITVVSVCGSHSTWHLKDSIWLYLVPIFAQKTEVEPELGAKEPALSLDN